MASIGSKQKSTNRIRECPALAVCRHVNQDENRRSVGIAGMYRVTEPVLIPAWGVNGAALGAAANMILWNAILLIQVRRRLAIWPTAIG